MSDPPDLLRPMENFMRVLTRALESLSTEDLTLGIRRGSSYDDKFLQVRINVQVEGQSLMDCGFTLSYLVKGGVNWDFFSLHCHECGNVPYPDYHRGVKFACRSCDTLIPVEMVYAQLQSMRRTVTNLHELSGIARSMAEDGLLLRGWDPLAAVLKSHEVWALCVAGHQAAVDAYAVTILQSLEAR